MSRQGIWKAASVWMVREREERGKEETVSKQDARHFTRQHLNSLKQAKERGKIHPSTWDVFYDLSWHGFTETGKYMGFQVTHSYSCRAR